MWLQPVNSDIEATMEMRHLFGTFDRDRDAKLDATEVQAAEDVLLAMHEMRAEAEALSRGESFDRSELLAEQPHAEL